MKKMLIPLKIILINILIFSSVEAVSRDNEDNLHLGVSMIVGGLGQYHFQNWKYSMAACLSIGLAKETLDEFDDDNAFDEKDFALDGIGCTLGVLTASYFWPSDSPNKLSFLMKGNETSLQYQYLF